MHTSNKKGEESPTKTFASAIKVMIADDDPPTRILLRAAIAQWGYEVVEASDGEEAWDILQQKNPPRLLILDWLMPKLDGIALCARIKKSEILHPYTILLTQVSGTTNIIKGLEAGADEFLSKPFNMAELRSRLSVGAKIITFENTLAEQNKKVQEYASRMESLAQHHAKQLVYHSDLLGMLGSLIEGISQEIYNTLENSDQSQKIQELRLSLEHIISVIKRLQMNSVYPHKVIPCQVNEIIKKIVDTCHSATTHMKIELDLAKNVLPIFAEPEQLQEIFLSLILSAAEATKNQSPAYLRIKTQLNKDMVQITMEDSGPPLPDAELQVMLKPHFVSHDLEQIQSRLSAAMSKEIVQQCGGTLSIENRSEGGTRFILHLPLKQEKNERAP